MQNQQRYFDGRAGGGGNDDATSQVSTIVESIKAAMFNEHLSALTFEKLYNKQKPVCKGGPILSLSSG